MARVTTEDCTDKEPNRFILVLIATCRAKAIHSGVSLTVSRDNDKDSVIALREIALGHVKCDLLKEELIRSLQTRSKVDILEDLIENEDSDKFSYNLENSEMHISEDHSDLDNGSFDDENIGNEE